MELYHLLLVVGCSVAWSGLDVFRKLLAPKLSSLALVFFLTLGQIPVLGFWAATQGLPSIRPLYWVVAAGSVSLNIAANTFFVVALRSSPLSLTVPLLSLTPVFTALFAIPILGEVPTTLQMIGILLVVVGALALGTERATSGIRAWARALLEERGAVLMVIVAFCWSLSMPLDKVGVAWVGAPWHALVLSAGVCAGTLGLLLWMGWRDQITAFRPALLPTLSGAVVVSALALGLQLLAIHVVFVGVVEAVKRAVGNFLALVLGAAVFSESVTLQKLLALGLMAGGVVLILL